MKYIKWILLGIFSFLVLYLGTVWIWTSSVAPELLKEMSRGSPEAALEPQYMAALIKI